jgi:hypothetical protein
MGGLCAFLFSVCYNIAEGVLSYLELGPHNLSEVLDWYSITPRKYRRHLLDVIHRSIEPHFPLPERLILVTLRDYDIRPNCDALRLLGELWHPQLERQARSEWDRLVTELYPTLKPKSGSVLLAASAIAQYRVSPIVIPTFCLYRANGTSSALLNGETPSIPGNGSDTLIDAFLGAMLPWARISTSKVRRAIAHHSGTRPPGAHGGYVLHLISRTPTWEVSETGLFDKDTFHFDVLNMHLAGTRSRAGPVMILSLQGLLSMACARSYQTIPDRDDPHKTAVRARLASWGYPVLERT